MGRPGMGRPLVHTEQAGWAMPACPTPGNAYQGKTRPRGRWTRLRERQWFPKALPQPWSRQMHRRPRLAGARTRPPAKTAPVPEGLSVWGFPVGARPIRACRMHVVSYQQNAEFLGQLALCKLAPVEAGLAAGGGCKLGGCPQALLRALCAAFLRLWGREEAPLCSAARHTCTVTGRRVSRGHCRVCWVLRCAVRRRAGHVWPRARTNPAGRPGGMG